MTQKDMPTVGLRPREFHKAEIQSLLQARGLEILAAMSRYIEVRKPIPEEWIDELRERFQQPGKEMHDSKRDAGAEPQEKTGRAKE